MKKVIIIGGGAAGMQTALRLAERGIEPLILEKEAEAIEKLRIPMSDTILMERRALGRSSVMSTANACEDMTSRIMANTMWSAWLLSGKCR